MVFQIIDDRAMQEYEVILNHINNLELFLLMLLDMFCVTQLKWYESVHSDDPSSKLGRGSAL